MVRFVHAHRWSKLEEYKFGKKLELQSLEKNLIILPKRNEL